MTNNYAIYSWTIFDLRNYISTIFESHFELYKIDSLKEFFEQYIFFLILAFLITVFFNTLVLRLFEHYNIIKIEIKRLNFLYNSLHGMILYLSFIYTFLLSILQRLNNFYLFLIDICKLSYKLSSWIPIKFYFYLMIPLFTYLINIYLFVSIGLIYSYYSYTSYLKFLGIGWDISTFYSFLPIIEDYLLAYNILREKTTTSQKLTVLLMTLKKTWKCDSLIVSALSKLDNSDLSLHSLTSIFTNNPIAKGIDTDNLVLQSALLDDLGHSLDSWDQIRVSPSYTHIKKLYILLLASNMFSFAGLDFDKRGYTAMEAALCKRDLEFGSDGVILHFLKSVHYIATTGFSIYEGKSITCLFSSNEKVDKWLNMYAWLISNSPFLKDPLSEDAPKDPDGNIFSESLFLNNLKENINLAPALQSFIDIKFPKQSLYFRGKTVELSKLYSDLMTKSACNTDRELPFSILINGTPGIGKSTFTNILFHIFAAYKCPGKNVLQRDDHYKYTRNFTQEFWDGFLTAMWCIILDDLAFQSVGISGTGDPSCMEFLQIVNTVPCIPNQASLEDKGRTPLRAKLVIGTTNTKDLNAISYYSCPSAALRRFPYVITLKVKKHLCSINIDEVGQTSLGTQLDSTKTSDDDYIGSLPNFWNIDVEYVSVSGNTGLRADYALLHTFDNITSFNNWYSQAITKHYETLSKMKASNSFMSEFALCSTCIKEESMCECNMELQSTNQTDPAWDIIEPLQQLSFFHSLKTLCASQIILIAIYFNEPLQRFCDICGYNNNFINFVEQRIHIDVHRRALAVRELRQYSNLWIALVLGLIGVFSLVLIKLLTPEKKKEKRKQFYHKDHVLQGQLVPKPIGTEKQNTWYHGSTAVVPYDIPRGSLSISADDTLKLVSRNTIILKIHKTNQYGIPYTTIIRAVGIESYYYLTLNHAFKGVDTNFVLDIIGTTLGGSNSNCSQTLNKDLDIKFVDDLALIRLAGYNQCRDIRQLIPKDENFKYTGEGTLVSRLQDTGQQISIPLKELMWSRTLISSNISIFGPRYTSNNALLAGSCGSPILVKLTHKNRYVLSSIHTAGPQEGTFADNIHEFASTESCLGLSTAINLLIIDSLKIQFDGTAPLSFREGHLGSINHKISLQSLHFKAPINFIEDGICNTYGSLDMPRNHSTSTVGPHYLADYFATRGYVNKMFAPDLRSWKPWRLALLANTDPVTTIKTQVLNDARDCFLDDILQALPDSLLKDVLHPVSFKVAINGYPSVAFIDSIPRSTSAGHPWRTSKQNLSVPCEPDEVYQDPVDYTSEIHDRVLAIEERYHSGERACPIFTASLKDEPVSASKIKSGKVRIFSGAPLDFSIVIRRKLLTFIRLVQRNREVFEAAPGLIAQSSEWHNLRRYLTKFGAWNIFAGDYQLFDKRMPPQFIFAAFHIIFRVCDRSKNYTIFELIELRGIMTDIAYAVTNFNGDLMMFFGSNPSGNPLTVIINSLVNSLYMRYIYHILSPNKSCKDFKANVALMTYGDDNVGGSRVTWFNHTAISETFLKELNIVYTMADKTSISVPFIHIDQASFLKRTWVFDVDVGEYLAKLDPESINKMLTIWVESKSISKYEQAIATLESAYREYFYYGKSVFEHKAKVINQAIDDNGLRYLLKGRKLPTWNELHNDYKENGRLDADMATLYEFKDKQLTLQSLDEYETCYVYTYYPLKFLIWLYLFNTYVVLILMFIWLLMYYFPTFTTPYVVRHINLSEKLWGPNNKYAAGLVFLIQNGYSMVSFIYGCLITLTVLKTIQYFLCYKIILEDVFDTSIDHNAQFN